MENDLEKFYGDGVKAIKEWGKLKDKLIAIGGKEQEEINQIKKKYSLEKEQVKKEIATNDINKDKLYNELSRLYNEILDIRGSWYTPDFILSADLIEGQKISTYEFFKKELEEMTGKKLYLYSFDTYYTEKYNEYDEYDVYTSIRRMYDWILMPEDVAKTLYEKSKKLELKDYIKVVKKLPNVFLLKRFWAEDNQHITCEKENEWNFSTEIEFNDYQDICNKGIFKDSDYNKNDSKYEKVILKTFAYWYKSKKREAILEEKRDMDKKLKKMEETMKRFEARHKELEKTEKDLGDSK